MAGIINPFEDPIPIKPFAVSSPAAIYKSHKAAAKTPASIYQSHNNSEKASLQSVEKVKQRRLKSARLIGEYVKPWTVNSPYRSRELADRFILWGCVALGFILGAIPCYFAYLNNVDKNEYCLIMDDNFENLDNWTPKVGFGSFGANSFDWTTNDPRNVYTDETGLHIVPTLTLESTDITPDQLMDGYTLNLTRDGTCSSQKAIDCVCVSNASTTTVIPPVRSAYLTTKGKKTIRYGRVEVVAKIPSGDWLWPAIWMMPQESVYGEWPNSGEIDIMESRGNSPDYYDLGSNTIYATLHWGFDYMSDFCKKTASWYIGRTDYSKDFHTYGFEWNEDLIYIWLDHKLLQIVTTPFGKKYGTMWQRSGAHETDTLKDPWSHTGRYNTPFDIDYYLIINLAIGTSGGFFADSTGNKPWVNAGSPSSRMDFWKANATWYPTWRNGGEYHIKSAKMWQLGKCASE